MTILLGGLDLGIPDELIVGTQKKSGYARQYMREPERLTRVTFVRLQQRNAFCIASRSTVAADKSPLLKTLQ